MLLGGGAAMTEDRAALNWHSLPLQQRLRELECPWCGGLPAGEASGAGDLCACSERRKKAWQRTLDFLQAHPELEETWER